MDATELLKNAPWIFALSLVGLAGFTILLAVGLNMYRQERKPPAPGASRAGWKLPAFLARLGARRPAETPETPALASTVPAPPGVAAGGLEVLRVLRHPLTGRLLVEIAGQRYAAVSEITDAEVRDGLYITLRDLQRYAGEPPAPGPVRAPLAEAAQPPPAPVEAAPAPVTAESPPPLAREPEAPPADAPAAPPASAAPAALTLNPLPPPRPTAPAGPAQPLRLPSMNPFKQMRVLRELGTQDPGPPKTIAEQIDEVLQHLIAGTPYAARGLRVAAGPRDSVMFWVEEKAYAGLEAVPDAEAQAVFREAIRQWEARQ